VIEFYKKIPEIEYVDDEECVLEPIQKTIEMDDISNNTKNIKIIHDFSQYNYGSSIDTPKSN
jgi:hypothetical protein